MERISLVFCPESEVAVVSRLARGEGESEEQGRGPHRSLQQEGLAAGLLVVESLQESVTFLFGGRCPRSCRAVHPLTALPGEPGKESQGSEKETWVSTQSSGLKECC